MKKVMRRLAAQKAAIFLACWLPALASAFAPSDPLRGALSFDEMELLKSGDEEAWALDGEASLGRDLSKFTAKLRGEKQGDDKSVEVQALYSKAISPHWDLQLGLRQDMEPAPTRSWAVVGLQGLAPGFIEVDAALFVGASGRSALRLEAEYDLLLSQRLILSPEVEVNIHGRDDEALQIASGLSTAEYGLRLRYEIRRELAPYVGLVWHKSFGGTAELQRAAGGESSGRQWLVGLRTWF